MNRYSVLRGTNREGIYTELGCSKGLPGFLTRIGASSPSATIDAALNFLVGFTRKQGYFEEKNANNAPVSVRYAPLYLHKLPEMPDGLKPFNLLSINGLEQRDADDGVDKRETVYSHNFFLEKELIFHKSEGSYCYLDQIFGTPLTSWVDVRDNRRQIHPLNLDAPPKVVSPILRPQDKDTVLNTIEAIYENKTVVIRLERECSFNARSWGILTQIYSLLQPRLAAEIGFATYVDEIEMSRLQKETSIRILVLAPETTIPTLPNSYRQIDLQSPTKQQPINKDLREILEKWYRLDWKKRQEALEALFDQDKLNYIDPDLFIQISNSFFGDPFFSWMKSSEDNESIHSLEDLYKKETGFAACKVTWCAEMFERKIPELLPSGVTLESLVARTLAEVREKQNKGMELSPKDKSLYRYALSLKSTKDYSGKFYEDVSKRKDSEWEAVVAETKKNKERLQQQYQEQIRALNESKESEIQQLRREKEEDQASLERAAKAKIAQIQTSCDQRIHDVEQEKASELEMLRSEKDDEIATTRSAAKAKIEQIRLQSSTALREKDDIIGQKDRIIAKSEAEKREALSELASRKDSERKKALDALRHQKDSERMTALADKEDEVRDLEKKLSRLEAQQNPNKKYQIMFFVALGVAIALLGALIFMILKAADTNGPTAPTDVSETIEVTEAPTEAPTEAKPDTTALERLLVSVHSLNKEEYSEASWQALTIEYEQALSVLNDGASTQESIDEAYSRLKNAVDTLMPRLVEKEENIDWADHAAIQGKIPEIRSIITEDIDAYIPFDVNGDIRILAVFSTADTLLSVESDTDNPVETTATTAPENEPVNENPAESAEATETPSNTENSGEPVREGEAGDGYSGDGSVGSSYAVILRGNIEKELAITVEDATLILRAGEHTVFVFGEDEIQLAAIKLLDYATTSPAEVEVDVENGPDEEQSETDPSADTAPDGTASGELLTDPAEHTVSTATEPTESLTSAEATEDDGDSKDFFLFKIGDSGEWINLMDSNIAQDWWRKITGFVWENEQIISEKYLAQLYNISNDPLQIIVSESYKVFVFDYSDNPDKATELVALYPGESWLSGNYVMIRVRNTDDQAQ